MNIENPYAAPANYTGAILPVRKQKTPFKPDVCDLCFAVITFVLGYLCSRWVFFSWQGWGVTVFTVLYLAAVTAYFMIKGIFVNNRIVWFWFAYMFDRYIVRSVR